MQRFEIGRLRWCLRPAKHAFGSSQQLFLPVGDLSGMYPELLSQFGPRLVAFDGGQRHLGLEGHSMIPSRSLHRLVGQAVNALTVQDKGTAAVRDRTNSARRDPL